MENMKYQLSIPKYYKEHGGKRLQATEAGRKTMEWEGTEEKRQARSENMGHIPQQGMIILEGSPVLNGIYF